MMHRPQARSQNADAIAISFLQAAIHNARRKGDLSLLASLETNLRRRVRQATRARVREARHTTYFAEGLNGKRAVERRVAQIARGYAPGFAVRAVGASLGVANGLVLA